MATTLVINTGSSSKKYALYKDGAAVLTCRFERSSAGVEFCSVIDGVQQVCVPRTESEYKDAFAQVLALAEARSLIASPKDISRVGVRIVAPGSRFAKHALIDEEFLAGVLLQVDRAPVHLPNALFEIDRVRALLPNAKLIAVSDSAFHGTIPPHVRNFSIAAADAKRLDLYRFGYHGLSAASVVAKLPRIVGALPDRIVVCHVGSGVSVTALKSGVSVDTTMGYAPGGGVIMSSRAGDLEPAALLALMEADQLTPAEAGRYVQTRGGLFGISGETDLRLILKRYAEHDEDAGRALDAFLYQLCAAVGAYVAALGGIDALVLTATAMERNSDLRRRFVERLAAFDIQIDAALNDATVGRDGIISIAGTAPAVYVVRTEEMKEMARITDAMQF